MADESETNAFLFADHLVLDDSPTRDFYKSVLQGLIHKNNNVLGVIQGFSSLILMDDVSKSVRDNIEQMRNASQTASDLSRVILTASGCSRVVCDPISLQELIPHIEQTAGECCEKSGVPLQFTTRPNLPLVLADGGKLSELLTELIRNAAEAAGEIPAGEVAIDILPPGEASPLEDGRVDFFIRNSSEPLSSEAIREAFIPFHGSKSSEHFGLGLTAAGVLAGQMGMKLGLRHSEGTTTAWLSLPATSA